MNSNEDCVIGMAGGFRVFQAEEFCVRRPRTRLVAQSAHAALQMHLIETPEKTGVWTIRCA